MEGCNDGRAGEDVGVCEVGPGCDGEGTTGVLGFDCAYSSILETRLPVSSSSSIDRALHTANVAEFPILKDQEAFPPRNLLKSFDGPFREIIDNIRMGFEYAYIVSNIFC